MDLSSEDLAALLQGDRDVFARVVRLHHRSLVAVARGMVGYDDAEEVVQKAWIKAFEGIAGFEGRARLRTWLTAIVINEARMQLRARRAAPAFESSESADPSSDWYNDKGGWSRLPRPWSSAAPEDGLMAEELRDCLAKTLAGLPVRQRAVLELKDFQQQDIAEIAGTLGLSEGNVRVLLHRARVHVYAAIDHYEATGKC